MTRMLTISPLLALGACGLFGGGDDDTMTGDTGPECVDGPALNDGVPVAGGASGAVGAAGLHVFVSGQFRYDAATDLPGSYELPDEPDAFLLSGVLLEIVPAMDPPDSSQNGCLMILPITEDNSTATSGVAATDVWGAEVRVAVADIVTNCGDPAYQTITDYAGGLQNLVANFANVMQVGIGEPSQEAIDTLVAVEGQSAEDFALGGNVQLGPDFPITEVLALATETDECGVVGEDRQLASDVLDGVEDSIFRMFPASDLIAFTITPG
ncbi:MAG: hypothetical protein AAGA48_13580 [Myxococcota bacterium]